MPSPENPLEALPLDALRSRRSLKWRTHPADVLPLWVAEMDATPCTPVVEAVTDAMRSGDTGYPCGLAYAEAFAAFAQRRWGWSDVDVARSALVPDVMVGIVEALRLVTAPGDAVVVNPPVYPPFFAFTEHAGRTVVDAALDPHGRIDLAALDDAFRRARAGGRTAAYLLCNPHNPLGTVHTSDELERIAALAARRGVRVIADEIHGPLVLPGAKFVPYLTVAGDTDAFVLTSASKGWNLAGLKGALLLAAAGAAPDLARLPEIVSHGCSHIGVLAHTAALQAGDPWLDALLDALEANRALLGTLLARRLPTVRWRPPAATYLAWLDCRATGLPGDDEHAAGRGDVMRCVGPAAAFLQRGRVALSSGAVFGAGG
ncbi:MAG: aminotransferase class I/II-fold pyridoxal phosphate-dependent enzyme, partial [Pseudonocardia sp.]